MGYTHTQFLRILPNAANGRPMELGDGRTVIDDGGGRTITVVLEPEQRRKIASISLPMTTVHFEFAGYGEDEADAEMEKFARHFHKGGG
jgi:hypothetical protein